MVGMITGEDRGEGQVSHTACGGTLMEVPGVEVVLHSVRPGGGVDEGDRVERAMAEERMRELEIELIETHGLGEGPG